MGSEPAAQDRPLAHETVHDEPAMARGKPAFLAKTAIADEDAQNREKPPLTGVPALAGEPAVAAQEPPVTGEAAAAGGDDLVTIVPGIARYHRGSCLLIRFLTADDLETMTRQSARDSGCVPCRACQPDGSSENG